MPVTLLTAPAAEPLTLSELKSFLRVDGTNEDPLIEALMRAARTHVETTLSMVLVAQRWRIIKDTWPMGAVMDLPFGPVATLHSVRVLGPLGWQVLPPSLFKLDGARQPPRLSWGLGTVPEPTPAVNGIEFEISAGFGTAADVPETLKQAMRILVAHWFEQRELTVIGHEVAKIPHSVDALLEPFRLRRLK